MKLLSLMRNKTKQSGVDPSKEFKGTLCCLKSQTSFEVQDLRTSSFSFSRHTYDVNPPEFEEEIGFEDRFYGFLAVGTLGMDPETPKFTDSVAEKDAKIEENQEMAKMITEKLDKFLELRKSLPLLPPLPPCRKKKKNCEVKQVKRLNGGGGGGVESDECSLQGYFLRSLIELLKRSNEVNKRDWLLTRLFKKREIVERDLKHKHGRDFIRKINGKFHQSFSKKRNDDDKDDDDDHKHMKKDHRKGVQIFRSKVHPVFCTVTRDNNDKLCGRPSSINSNFTDRNGCNEISDMNGEFPGSSSIMEANRNGEKWIKTDKEYYVLEL